MKKQAAEQTPRERLAAALTNQPFEAWPGYLWTKLGNPLDDRGIENAIAIHTERSAAETSNFKVWLAFTDQPADYTRKSGTPTFEALRWTVNVQHAVDAARVYVAYWDAWTSFMDKLGGWKSPQQIHPSHRKASNGNEVLRQLVHFDDAANASYSRRLPVLLQRLRAHWISRLDRRPRCPPRRPRVITPCVDNQTARRDAGTVVRSYVCRVNGCLPVDSTPANPPQPPEPAAPSPNTRH
jgi:hypothetical protein